MRYFVGFLITIGLIIVLIVMLFGGGDDKATLPTSKKLVTYANTNAEARMTIDGPVNADQIHRRIQITVSRDEVTYKHTTGYEGKVVKQTRYDNNSNAYAHFLRSLSIAGYSNGDPSENLKDERGHCPLSNRYIFEFTQGDKKIQRLWATDCKGPKSFLGNLNVTTQLFEAQIPDFDTVNREAELS